MNKKTGLYQLNRPAEYISASHLNAFRRFKILN
jgi:hypothetical protein